jgi:hypothetical protein
LFSAYLFGAFPYVADSIASRGATLSSPAAIAWTICSFFHHFNWSLWLTVLLLAAAEGAFGPVPDIHARVCRIVITCAVAVCMLLLGGSMMLPRRRLGLSARATIAFSSGMYDCRSGGAEKLSAGHVA